MTIASYISCLRIVLIVPIIYFLGKGFWQEAPWSYNYLALILFILAGITDYLDGYIARKTDTESQIGALLDLVADKLLVSLVMIWLVYLSNDVLITIPALIIVSRELVISTLRQYVIENSHKNKLNVSYIGKSKTTIQIISISMLILERENSELWLLSIVAIWFAALFSMYSLFSYTKGWSKYYLN